MFAAICQLAAVLFVTGPALATSLPETYPMSEAEPRPHPVDPALAAWLEEHVERPYFVDLDTAAYAAFLDKQDVVTRLYADLARANRKGKPAEAKTALEAALRHLGDPAETQKAETFTHPVVPFLYEEILKAATLPQGAREMALAGLNQHGAGSCAQKDVLFDDISKERLSAMSDEGLRGMLDKIDVFRSPNYRRNTFRKYIQSLPESRREAVETKLITVLAPNPTVLNQFDWLKAAARKLLARDVKARAIQPKKSPFLEPYASFAEAKDLAGKKQCAKAKTEMLHTITSTTDTESLDEAMTAAKAVDGCLKGRDSTQRRQFWEAMQAPMQKAYGFAGWAEVRLRMGYIFWVGNDYDQAKPLMNEVREAAAKEKKLSYEARAVYSLGRVAEDEEDQQKAAGYFKDYVGRFEGQENYEDALTALVLIHVDRREWNQGLAALDRYIQTESVEPVDKRSVGGMAFALFWAGRIRLEQGDVALATEMWRRVASEYYSTYYGAIGHYMLEKLTGRVLSLQPARAPSFRMTALRQSFSVVDRQRVRRVEMLMRLGMRGEAACELDELGTDDGNPEKILVKALMLHASGHWLDAIKAYDSLPRGYRLGLPIGLERLVFPRRYAESIYKYAERAKVDPDFVMAIIRQESVFNPNARSPVGAMGLMQLMPHTAKVEASRLASDYVTQVEKRQLKEHALDPRTLANAESNLAIGIHHVASLMSRYPGPVYVLSAYNASPGAAARWMQTLATKDVLSFIEKIPYKETRAYVKLVLRNYFYYKRWYGPPTNELPQLDAVTSPLLASMKPE